MLQVIVDEAMCMSAGECVYKAPRTFAFGDDNRSKVIDATGDDDAAVIAAALACPNFAISVRRDGVSVV